MRRTSDYPLLLVTLLVALAAGLGACGGDDGEAQPQASDVPSGAVAVVGGQTVPEQELDRRVRTLRRAQSRDAKLTRRQLERQALSQILYDTALAQEARTRGVAVTRAEVRARLAAAKRQFESRAAFRRFLGRQTEADLLRNLRQQLLTQEVLERVAGNGGSSQRATRELRKRWSAKTACAEGYVTIGCGNARE